MVGAELLQVDDLQRCKVVEHPSGAFRGVAPPLLRAPFSGPRPPRSTSASVQLAGNGRSRKASGRRP